MPAPNIITKSASAPPFNPKLYCTICKQHFDFKQTLATHLESHRKPLISSLPGATKCRRCNVWFESQASLKKHFAEKRDVHPWCDDCERGFLSKNDLYEHYMNSDSHHYCLDCDAHLESADVLREHESWHMGEVVTEFGRSLLEFNDQELRAFLRRNGFEDDGVVMQTLLPLEEESPVEEEPPAPIVTQKPKKAQILWKRLRQRLQKKQQPSTPPPLPPRPMHFCPPTLG